MLLGWDCQGLGPEARAGVHRGYMGIMGTKVEIAGMIGVERR